MNEAMTKDRVKFDILVEIKTLCRKAKTTTWAQLIGQGFKIGDCEWGEEDHVIHGSGEGHARMGLLASYMADTNRVLNPDLAKLILPEMEGCANGIGHIVLVGYKEDAEKPEPLITLLFEFSQKPGEKIKISKSAQAYFERETEINKDPSSTLVHDLYTGLEAYKAKHGGVPRLEFVDEPDTPELLRGRRFSPCLTRNYTEIDGKKHLVLHIREHTDEPEGVVPPYLFSLSVEEGNGGVLWLTYEGNADPTEEQKELVNAVVLALRATVTNNSATQPVTAVNVPY